MPAHQLCQSVLQPECARVPGVDRSAARVVAAVPVHEQEAAEALVGQRVEQVGEQRAVRLDAQRRAARVGGEVRRQPVGERGHDEHAERLGRLVGDTLREDPVDAERQVGVLLDRAERHDDPVVAFQVLLDLHPVAVLDPHRVTSSNVRATESRKASLPAAAASCRPAGKVPSAMPQGTDTAGVPARLYGAV